MPERKRLSRSTCSLFSRTTHFLFALSQESKFFFSSPPRPVFSFFSRIRLRLEALRLPKVRRFVFSKGRREHEAKQSRTGLRRV